MPLLKFGEWSIVGWLELGSKVTHTTGNICKFFYTRIYQNINVNVS